MSENIKSLTGDSELDKFATAYTPPLEPGEVARGYVLSDQGVHISLNKALVAMGVEPIFDPRYDIEATVKQFPSSPGLDAQETAVA